VEQGLARFVVVAKDADARMLRDLLASCERHGVTVTYAESMKLLGEASGIKVGAAAAAVLEE
jgi:large subunit ribosomal protein L7A